MKKIFLLSFVFILIIEIIYGQQKAFDVKVYGSGEPVILIPGYSCSGEVWNETVAHLKDHYQLHVLTLAGFAGVPAIQQPILQTERDSIISYIKENNLQKPVIMGHSLGAFMAFWIASAEPDLCSKIICVDGLPFISAMQNENVTADSVKKDPRFSAEAMASYFLSLPDSNYEKNQAASMFWQVNDTARAKQIAHWSFLSDRRTLGYAYAEMSSTDLRQEIAKIKCPVLMLGSIYYTKENSEKIINAQLKNLSNKTIEIADSKHFIMYDVPEWFYNKVDNFLR